MLESYLIFYLISGVFLIAEAFTPGTFLFICFAIATAITGVIDQVSDLNLAYLLGINLLLSIAAFFLARPILKTLVKIPSEADPIQFGNFSERLIGREGMVFKPITTAEPGVVKLLDFDETWLAWSEDGEEIGQGSNIRVKEIKGNHLIVGAN